MAFDYSTYRRHIRLLNPARSSVVETLCDLSLGTNVVTDASFTLLRLGGCGSGSITLAKEFDYSALQIGQWVDMSYATTPWYLGRVANIDANHPSGVTVSLEGMFNLLSDFPVGGSGDQDVSGPQVVAANNYYYHDPNIADQEFISKTTYRQVLDWLVSEYMTPLGISTGTITDPSTPPSFYSFTFSGESSVAEVVRTLAETMYNASYGVDAAGNFFFIPVSEGKTDLDGYPSTPQVTYQIGADLQRGTALSTTRSVFYNRVQLVGGYVYGDIETRTGNYRYTAFGYDDTYASTLGYRTARISVPFVRNDWAAFQWMEQFFKKYGGPRTRYTFTTIAQGSTLVTPWGGSVRLNDALGSEITTDLFDEVQVSFNRAPYYTITTGPEDLQYPEADVQDAQEASSNGSGGSGDNSHLPAYPGGGIQQPPGDPYFTDRCNEEHTFTPTGTITAGTLTFTYELNDVSTAVTVDFDATGWEIETELIDTHAQVNVDDLLVTGSVTSGFTIKWMGQYADKAIDLPTVDFSALTGATDYTVEKTVECDACPCPATTPDPVTTGACGCKVGSGVVKPVVSPPHYGKAAFDWDLPTTILTALQDVPGFEDVTTLDVRMSWNLSTYWQSLEFTRTCDAYTSDDYVVTLEQIAASVSRPLGGWKLTIALVGSDPDPDNNTYNCDDQLYWVFTSADAAIYGDRTNRLRLDFEATKPPKTSGYVDPPESCLFCLDTTLGNTSLCKGATCSDVANLTVPPITLVSTYSGAGPYLFDNILSTNYYISLSEAQSVLDQGLALVSSAAKFEDVSGFYDRSLVARFSDAPTYAGFGSMTWADLDGMPSITLGGREFRILPSATLGLDCDYRLVSGDCPVGAGGEDPVSIRVSGSIYIYLFWQNGIGGVQSEGFFYVALLGALGLPEVWACGLRDTLLPPQEFSTTMKIDFVGKVGGIFLPYTLSDDNTFEWRIP